MFIGDARQARAQVRQQRARAALSLFFSFPPPRVAMLLLFIRRLYARRYLMPFYALTPRRYEFASEKRC